MNLNADKTLAEISIKASLSAQQLETLIADLALLRGNMAPQVPYEVPDPTNSLTATQNVSIQDDPYFALRLLRDGRIRLWLRNHGLGWLVFNLPVDKACVARDYLVANTPTVESSPNLFIDDLGDRGTSH